MTFLSARTSGWWRMNLLLQNKYNVLEEWSQVHLIKSHNNEHDRCNITLVLDRRMPPRAYHVGYPLISAMVYNFIYRNTVDTAWCDMPSHLGCSFNGPYDVAGSPRQRLHQRKYVQRLKVDPLIWIGTSRMGLRRHSFHTDLPTWDGFRTPTGLQDENSYAIFHKTCIDHPMFWTFILSDKTWTLGLEYILQYEYVIKP